MNKILASLTVQPNLDNKRVCLINEDNTFSFIRVAPWVVINDNFSPKEYAISEHPKYGKSIVYSTIEEVEDWESYEREHKNVYNKIGRPFPCRIGDKIHIKSRRGIYTVSNIRKGLIQITCMQWIREGGATHWIEIDNFKCLAGGRHNQVHY